MFVHNPHRLLNLDQYGIQIPLLDKRFLMCQKWIEDNQAPLFIMKDLTPMSDQDLGLVHNEDYIQQLNMNPENAILTTFELIDENGKYHRYDPTLATKPISEMVDRIRGHVRSSVTCAELALQKGFSFFLGGGLHHAMTFGGRGFCLLNDLVLSARLMQQQNLAKQIWIIDVDAHKGDGTAEITQNDKSITTFSIHMKKGWPLVTPRFEACGKLYPWYIDSDIDIELDRGEESLYLEKLNQGLNSLWENFPRPDLVLVNLGSDPYEHDELESTNSMRLSLEQMHERDISIFNFFKERHIPQAYYMSGGYGQRAHEPYLLFFEYLKNKKII